MDKAKKNRIKKYITWVSMTVFVAMLALMPLLAGSNQELSGPQASTLSGTVETGSITTSLYGGGTLSSQVPVEISLPEGVKITEFLVANGDLVSEGDPLAVLDPVSIMNAITGVQDTMDYLVEEMAKLHTQQRTTSITAKAGGLVKQIFAEAGDNVQDVMLEHGALAVLSLDGMMAVDIESNTTLATGDPVSVIFGDETAVPGRVESNMEGILVVTVEDADYEVGQTVQVTDTAGNPIGSGELYVHNAWRAVAYSGTVQSVNIKPETDAYPGQLLLTIQESTIHGQVESLASQHRKYENLMLELFQLYQADTINAPCDGLISGVDENSIHLLSAASDALRFDFLANAPGSDPDGLFDNHVGQLEGILGSTWIVKMNPESVEITDYKEALTSVDTSADNMTYHTMMDPVTVYELVNGQWEIGQATTGDILLLALNDDGFIWAVRIGTTEPEITEPTESPTEPGEETVPSDPEEPTDPEAPTAPEDPSEPDEEGFPDIDIPSMGGSWGGMFGGFMGGIPQEEEYQLYSLEKATLLSVVPQQEMTLKIQLDERDISKVYIGMQAEVTVAALHHSTFPAVVTKIGDRGTNLGGSSKFTVELLLNMEENMLSGMSATASIPLFITENIPVIPVEALVEEGANTVVYTGYDEKTDSLINPVAVTCGHSDGIYAEILSGLNIGDTFWYLYYDTLELDHSVENPNFGFG